VQDRRALADLQEGALVLHQLEVLALGAVKLSVGAGPVEAVLAAVEGDGLHWVLARAAREPAGGRPTAGDEQEEGESEMHEWGATRVA
jgi:hypothetical protein